MEEAKVAVTFLFLDLRRYISHKKTNTYLTAMYVCITNGQHKIDILANEDS